MLGFKLQTCVSTIYLFVLLWGAETDWAAEGFRQSSCRLLDTTAWSACSSRVVLWPCMLSSHQATSDLWLVMGCWSYTVSQRRHSCSSRGRHPQAPIRLPSHSRPAAAALLQGAAAWHWCGCTAAAEGEGSRKCYLWGNASKWFKNVFHPCQTFFISQRHSNRLVLVAWFSVERRVTFVLPVLLLTHMHVRSSNGRDTLQWDAAQNWGLRCL